MHLVNVASIPTGPTHGERRLQPHPGDVLQSTPKVRKSPRSGLNLEGRLSDPQCFFPFRVNPSGFLRHPRPSLHPTSKVAEPSEVIKQYTLNNTPPASRQPPACKPSSRSDNRNCLIRDLLGIDGQPLGLHLVNVGSIPTGPTHGEGRLHPHPGDVLKSTPNVRKSPRSGLNLEGRLSDPQVFFSIQTLKSKFIYSSAPIDAERRRWPSQLWSEDWGGSSFSENSVINVFFSFTQRSFRWCRS